MTDEQLLIYLSDCFSAGYQMPQYCIDNNIKKPLFIVPNENHWQILWNIHVQFFHDKRIKPQFALLKGKFDSLRLSPGTIFDELKIKNYGNLDLDNFDKIFFLAKKKSAQDYDKIIYLEELVKKFIIATYLENPLLHFLEYHPHIKLFLTNFPIMSDNPIKTENELQIVKNPVPLATMTSNLKKDSEYKTPYDFLGYSRQDLIDMLTLTGTKTNPDGSTVLIDNDNPLVNVKNGRRVTAYQPDYYKNTIV